MANEVKTVFTIDLTAFVEGLKAMLSMTATAGQQLKPLLNVSVKAPDYSGLEKQLQDVAKKTQEYLSLQDEAAKTTDGASNSEKRHGEETRKAGVEVEGKALKLNKMKREALESFGAVSFLALGIVQLSSAATGGSQKLDRLSQGMSQGISAGFGLAGTLSMLGVVTGGWAVAIGVAIAAGVAFLKFMDDSEDRAKRLQAAMQMFANSLRGASTQELEQYRANLIAGIDASNKYAASLEAARNALSAGDLAGRAALLKAQNEEEARRNILIQERAKLDEELTSREKTQAEVRQFIRAAETAATTNQFEQRRQVADATYRQEQQDYKGHADALRSARNKHAAEMERIAQDEAKFEQQVADAKFEGELASIRSQGMQRGANQQQVDLMILDAQYRHYAEQYQRLSVLGDRLSSDQRLQKQQLESRLTQIQADEADKRVEIQRSEQTRVMSYYDLLVREQIAFTRISGATQAKTQEQVSADVLDTKRRAVQAELNAITQGEADKRQIAIETGAFYAGLTEEEQLRKRELEVQLTEIAAEGAEARRSLMMSEFEAFAGVVGNLSAAANTVVQTTQQKTSKQISEERKSRQATLDAERDKLLASAKTAEERDKINKDYAAKKSAIDAEMDSKAKRMNADAVANSKALAKVRAIIDTYQAANKALASAPPPFNFILAAAVVAAGLANVAAINDQEVPGYAKGGRLQKGRPGYFEGEEPEIVAPEKDFMQIWREELRPQIVDRQLIDVSLVWDAAGLDRLPLPDVQAEQDLILPWRGAVRSPGSVPMVDTALAGDAEMLRRVLFPQIATDVRESARRTSEESRPTVNLSVNIQIDTLYGEREHFEQVIRPAMQEAMRQYGVSRVDDLIVNVNRQETRLNA